MGELSWNVLLVPSGIENIRIKRNGHKILEGTYPAGFSQHLEIGDSVHVKLHRHGWIKKFGICVWRGVPAIRFGKTFGDGDRYVRLDMLPYVPHGTFRGKTRVRVLNTQHKDQ